MQALLARITKEETDVVASAQRAAAARTTADQARQMAMADGSGIDADEVWERVAALEEDAHELAPDPAKPVDADADRGARTVHGRGVCGRHGGARESGRKR